MMLDSEWEILEVDGNRFPNEVFPLQGGKYLRSFVSEHEVVYKQEHKCGSMHVHRNTLEVYVSDGKERKKLGYWTDNRIWKPGTAPGIADWKRTYMHPTEEEKPWTEEDSAKSRIYELKLLVFDVEARMKVIGDWGSAGILTTYQEDVLEELQAFKGGLLHRIEKLQKRLGNKE